MRFISEPLAVVNGGRPSQLALAAAPRGGAAPRARHGPPPTGRPHQRQVSHSVRHAGHTPGYGADDGTEREYDEEENGDSATDFGYEDPYSDGEEEVAVDDEDEESGKRGNGGGGTATRWSDCDSTPPPRTRNGMPSRSHHTPPHRPAFAGPSNPSPNGLNASSSRRHGAAASRRGCCRSQANRALCLLTIVSVVVMGCTSVGMFLLAHGADGEKRPPSRVGGAGGDGDDARLLILATRRVPEVREIDWTDIAIRHPHWRDLRALVVTDPPAPSTDVPPERETDHLLSRMHFRVADTIFTVKPILEDLIRLLEGARPLPATTTATAATAATTATTVTSQPTRL
jgi:hypothetical protein